MAKGFDDTVMTLTYKHTVYASYLGYVTQAIVNNLAPLLFLAFQRDFAISLEKISLLISLNFGIQIVTDFVSAKFLDKMGYRFGVVLAHILCTIGLVCLGTLPFVLPNPYVGLLLAVAINAVGGGLTEVLISPIVEAVPGEEKAGAMSLLHSFYCWGQVGVVLLSTLYFTLVGVEHWAYLPVLWAILPLVNTFFFLKVPLCQLTEEGQATPMRKLFRVRIFWIFLVLMLCAGASELAMSQWASLFAESGLGVSKTLGDLLGPCAFAVLMGLSRVFFGVKGSKVNLVRALTGSSVLCVACYILAAVSPIPILSLVGCALCGLSVGLMWPGVYSLAAQYYPQGGTAMFAVLALAGDLGCSAGPGLVGVLADVTGALQNGLFFAIVFPVTLVIFVRFLPRKKDTASVSAISE